ncbi:MAG TPA: hypothetical protein VIS48_00430 [Candidatus Kryptonia bacterium]
MFIVDLIVALAVGLFIVWIVSLAFGTRGPWGSLLWFFLVVSLFAWAGGVWLVPFGPMWGGMSWLPIVCMGILAALLLTAASPRAPRRRMTAQEEDAKDKAQSESRAVIDVIFWVVIICLLLLAISHYAWYPHYTLYPRIR